MSTIIWAFIPLTMINFLCVKTRTLHQYNQTIALLAYSSSLKWLTSNVLKSPSKSELHTDFMQAPLFYIPLIIIIIIIIIIIAKEWGGDPPSPSPGVWCEFTSSLCSRLFVNDEESHPTRGGPVD